MALTIYQLKPAFQNCLRPLVRKLAQGGVTANQITLLACALSVGLGALIAIFPEERRLLWAVPALLFVRMALNAVDGMLAREHAQKSRLGGILNELTDVLSDAALYASFARIAGLSGALIALVVWLSAVSEFSGVLGVTIGAQRRYDGPMGKSDRAFVFGAIAILLAAGLAPGAWCSIVLALVAGLTAWGALNRCRAALREPA